MKDILVVGAGFSGATVARTLANAGYRVTVIDKRNHAAGNAYDYTDEHGIRIHKYGPHIFHTSNDTVMDWLKCFGEWTPYQHKVKAILADGTLVTLPPNLQTASIVGKDNIIDTLFRPYTKKMWGVDIEELDPNILARVPIRNDENELYFPNDKYQFMPVEGYTAIILNILSHENITVKLETIFEDDMRNHFQHTFNSMPIDEYFDFDLGELPYRSIKFHHKVIPAPRLIAYPTINFTNDGIFTRMTEWKNYPGHGQNSHNTVITFEEPCDYRENNNERYYPVKDLKGVNRMKYNQYKEREPKNMTFIGRCGQYVYLDMHQAISNSFAVARNFMREDIKL